MKIHSFQKMIPFILVALLLGACTESKIEVLPATNELISEESQPKLPTVEDNLLVFEDIKHFRAVVKSIEGKSREFLDNWESQLGFKSMRFFFDEANDEYENIRDQAHLDDFKNRYKSKIIIAEDGTIEMLLDIYYMGSVINTEGLVKIGTSLQYYDKDKTIIVEDGDEVKMAEALKKGQHVSDLDNGLIYIKKETVSLGANTKVGGTNFEETEVKTNGNSNGSRRLKISAKCHVWSQYQYVYDGNNNGSYLWLNFWRVITKAESHEKKWWGWKRRTTDFYETFSYQVAATYSSGNNSFPLTITQAKIVETYRGEYEAYNPGLGNACFTQINYAVQGGSQNWATATINY